MREIKWRFKNTYEEGFTFYTLQELLSFGDGGIDLSSGEQYTELKDKNGVEIYGNDIIKSEYYNGVIRYINNVKFDYVGWYIVETDEYGESPQAFDSDNAKYFEVIGNVHERGK